MSRLSGEWELQQGVEKTVKGIVDSARGEVPQKLSPKDFL